MPPAKYRFDNWFQRKSDATEQIEPYRTYYFVCEGSNTEIWYFDRLIGFRKELGISATIRLCLIEKTEEDETSSSPRKLLEFVEREKAKLGDSFDENRDKIIVVFDADIFEGCAPDFDKFLHQASDKYLLGASNPSFELFLLLHYPDAYNKWIRPKASDILKNEWVGEKRFVGHLFTEVSGWDAKKRKIIGSLAEKIDIAIEEEKHINENPFDCQGEITCNIAKLIDDIRHDE